jgi:hypothetical protein
MDLYNPNEASSLFNNANGKVRTPENKKKRTYKFLYIIPSVLFYAASAYTFLTASYGGLYAGINVLAGALSAYIGTYFLSRAIRKD